MWDLVGNPEDRFSQNEAQIILVPLMMLLSGHLFIKKTCSLTLPARCVVFVVLISSNIGFKGRILIQTVPVPCHCLLFTCTKLIICIRCFIFHF